MIISLEIFEWGGSVIVWYLQSFRGRRCWCIKRFWKITFHKTGEMQHIKIFKLEGKGKERQNQKYEMTSKTKI